MNEPAANEFDHWPTWALLDLVSRLARHHWATYLAQRQLSSSGYGILAALSKGAISQAQLAKLRQVGPQSLGRSVDRLERLGLVLRSRHPRDRRQLLVRRTKEGGRLVAQVSRQVAESESWLRERLSDPEQFRGNLLTLVRMLQAADADSDRGGAPDGGAAEAASR